MFYPDKNLDKDQLEILLGQFFDKIVPNLEHSVQARANKEEIIKSIVENLMSKDYELTFNDLKDPRKQQEIFTIITVELLKIFNKDESILNKIKPVLDKLKKEFDKDVEKKPLIEESEKFVTELQKELEKVNTPKLQPQAKKEQEKEEEDKYIAIYGLVNSRIAGGYPAVIQVCLGTALRMAYKDENPNQGNAEIDAINKIDDVFDSISNAITKMNYRSEGIIFDEDELDKVVLPELKKNPSPFNTQLNH